MILGLLSDRGGFARSWQGIAAIGLASFAAVYLTIISADYFPVRGVRFAVAAFVSILIIQTLAELMQGERLSIAVKHSLKSGLLIGAAGGLGIFLASVMSGGSIS